MKIRPFLTYDGKCEEALELYKRAFNTDVMDIMRFSDTGGDFPEDYMDRIMQATLRFGDDFIRMMDCGPGHGLNDRESETISLAVECKVSEVRHAFAVLSEEGRVGIPLQKTFFSECHGVVFDKFGIMWNFVGSG